MRLFLALELQPTTAAAVDLAVLPLREIEPKLGWVPAERLHLTMKFLGDADEGQVIALAAALDSVAAGHRASEMTLAEVGAFPNFRRPRVVWLGVESEPRLELLHHDLELACADLGYEVEGRPFRPHLTLARVREPLPVDRARAFARAARRIAFSAAESVERITLFDSTTGGSGARYRQVHVATLGGR